MALTKGDKTWIKDTIVDSLTEFHRAVEEPVMNEVLGRLGNVETRMGNLETRMGDLEGSMVAMETRLDGMESEVSGLKKAVWNVSDHQGKRLDEHEKRIVALEEA